MNDFKKLPDISIKDQTPLTHELIQMILDLQENVRDLHDEILCLKGLKARPKPRPSKMDKSISSLDEGDGEGVGEDGSTNNDESEKKDGRKKTHKPKKSYELWLISSVNVCIILHMNRIYKPNEFGEKIGKFVDTLRRWDRNGTLKAKRTPTGHRYYDDEDVRKYLGIKKTKRKTVVYCRVSSHGQKDDLKSQVAAMENFCLSSGVSVDEWAQEIAGGMNFKRKKFLKIMSEITEGKVEKLLIAHKDRLARFGFDFFQHLADEKGFEFIVVNQESLSPQQEMVEDLMAIIHTFSCRLYGLRKYKKKIREVVENESHQDIPKSDLTDTKLGKLSQIVQALGKVRADAWNRFGFLSGVGKHHREIRSEWVKSEHVKGVPARLWKATLIDVHGDIKAYRTTAADKVKKAIFKKYSDKETRTKKCRALNDGKWVNDKYLRRMMRKYFKHGHTSVDHQIILDSGCYTWFERNGQGWLSVQGMERSRRIAIPLNTDHPVTGTIRLIVNDKVEVHHVIESEGRPCGTGKIGIDKGFTEAFVDSEGESHGVGLGAQIIANSDRLKTVYQNRSKLRAIAEKKPHKTKNIIENNLGRKKLNTKKQHHECLLRDIAHKAANSIFDKAECVAVEYLTSPIKSKINFGKNQQRRLSSWVKGLLVEALDNVSARRSASVVLVNAAYTSQTCSTCGALGTRKGDAFYCTQCKVELHADQNTAKNVLSRLHDPQIDRWTNFKKVKSILIERFSQSVETVPPGLELQPT